MAGGGPWEIRFTLDSHPSERRCIETAAAI